MLVKAHVEFHQTASRSAIMDDVYYEDEGQRIVDAWLAGGASVSTKAKATTAVALALDTDKKDGKRGLGFAFDKANSKSSNKYAAEKNGKSMKRKLYDVDEDEESEGEMHGIVEDVIEKAKKAVTYSDQLLARTADKASVMQAKHATSKSNNDDSNNAPWKRPKTRSKQKNIRKDNRPVEQRPSGSWSRPLTPQTKVKIGVAGVTGALDEGKKKRNKKKKIFKHLQSPENINV